MANQNVLDVRATGPKPLAIESNEAATWATGTKEQIVAAGLCAHSIFPTGRKKTASIALDDGGHISIRATKGNLWSVVCRRPFYMRDALREEAKRRAEMRRKLEAMASSLAAWKQAQIDYFEHNLSHLVGRVKSSGDGIFISEEASRALDALSKRMCVVLAAAPASLDKQAREAFIQENTPRGPLIEYRPQGHLRLVVNNTVA